MNKRDRWLRRAAIGCGCISSVWLIFMWGMEALFVVPAVIFALLGAGLMALTTRRGASIVRAVGSGLLTGLMMMVFAYALGRLGFLLTGV